MFQYSILSKLITHYFVQINVFNSWLFDAFIGVILLQKMNNFGAVFDYKLYG